MQYAQKYASTQNAKCAGSRNAQDMQVCKMCENVKIANMAALQ
jgi:hypothetical protein